MTNLTSPSPREFRGSHLDLSRSTYDAAGVVYEGAAVQLDGSGNLVNATGAGTTFAGFADESATAAGDRINVIDYGKVQLTVAKGSSWAKTDVGAIVYATDGNTFTLVATSAQKVGRVAQVLSGTGTTSAQAVVNFIAVQRRNP
jgi:hypothetical protein